MRLLTLLLLLTASLLSTAQRLVVDSESTLLLADTLPEYLTGPWAEGPEGNQISGVVRCMLQDKEGTYWFGTQHGPASYNGTHLYYYDVKDTLDQRIVPNAVKEGPSGNIWFAHDGGITRYDGTTFSTYTSADGLRDDSCWNLYFDTDDLLWIGTMGGVATYDGTTFGKIDLPPAELPLSSRGVRSKHIVWSITQDCQQRMWFAQEGGVYYMEGDEIHRLELPTPEGEKVFVGNIMELGDGDLLMATNDHGMMRYDGNEFSFVRAGPKGKGEASRLLEDSKGNVWYSIENVALCRYNGQEHICYDQKDGMGSSSVHGAIEDDRGRIWFFGWMGVYRYAPENEDRAGEQAFVNVTRNGPW